jgi:pyruvate formate lyase activating enzyme
MSRQDPVLGTVFSLQEYAVQDGPGIRTIIFLKGCPLRCRWCSNPEGQRPEPELLHSRTLCRRCQTCVRVCPQGAVSIDPAGYPRFCRELCRHCPEPACTQACPQQALRIAGHHWTAEALYTRVQSNALFYRNSQGGLTLSGGEPLAQPAFVGELVRLCSQAGLSVGIETCGLFDWPAAAGYVDSLDFFYVDIKCLDSALHRQVTGKKNDRIL